MDIHSTGLSIAPQWVPHVLAAWVCGSAARGDVDSSSDLDVTVVIGDDLSPSAFTGEPVVCTAAPLIDFSVYTLSGFKNLITPPSLFAWHLALEGQLIVGADGEVVAMLEHLGPFVDHVEDLLTLRHLALECAESLSLGPQSLVFDLGVLGTVVRNTALIVTHFDGRPDFSRSAPERLVNHTAVPLPIGPSQYAALAQARKAGEGVAIVPTVSWLDAKGLTERVTEWVTQCLHYVGGAS